MLQGSSKRFLISIFFPLVETPPPCPTPARYFVPRTIMTYFLQFCSYNFFCQYLYTNIALQNTDFGVLQGSSKRFLISIFFPLVETPPPCPTPARYFVPRTIMTYFLQFCSYNFFCQYLYTNIALQNTDFGVLQKSSKRFLISIFFPPVEGHPLPVPPSPPQCRVTIWIFDQNKTRLATHKYVDKINH